MTRTKVHVKNLIFAPDIKINETVPFECYGGGRVALSLYILYFCVCVIVNVIKYTHQLFVLLMLYVEETVLLFI